MNEPADNPDTTAVTDAAFAMRGDEATQLIKRYLQLRHQLLHLHRQSAAGEDQLDADIFAAQLMWRFMRADPVLAAAGVQLPSGQFWSALSGVQEGTRPDYFKRGKLGRPIQTARLHLIGVVAHLVETLAVGKMFGAGKAAKEVVRRLNSAGLCMPDGRSFTADRVTDWHEHVVHSATRSDTNLAWHTYDQLQAGLMKAYPEHKGWKRERLLAWLEVEAVPRIARLGYFRRMQPKGDG
jgi:hypothetical protein